MNNAIDGLLTSADLAITNALNDEQIMQELQVYTFDKARIEVGQKLLKETVALNQQQQKEYGDQYGATKARDDAWEIAHKVYMKSVKIARIAFNDDPGALAALQLNGDRKRSISGWLNQAKTYYGNLMGNPKWLQKMQQYGYSTEKLKGEVKLVDAVETANQKANKELGEAQESTQIRDAKLDQLQKWFSEFIGVLRVALSDNPQQLEKLGIVVKS